MKPWNTSMVQRTTITTRLTRRMRPNPTRILIHIDSPESQNGSFTLPFFLRGMVRLSVTTAAAQLEMGMGTRSWTHHYPEQAAQAQVLVWKPVLVQELLKSEPGSPGPASAGLCSHCSCCQQPF